MSKWIKEIKAEVDGSGLISAQTDSTIRETVSLQAAPGAPYRIEVTTMHGNTSVIEQEDVTDFEEALAKYILRLEQVITLKCEKEDKKMMKPNLKELIDGHKLITALTDTSPYILRVSFWKEDGDYIVDVAPINNSLSQIEIAKYADFAEAHEAFTLRVAGLITLIPVR